MAIAQEARDQARELEKSLFTSREEGIPISSDQFVSVVLVANALNIVLENSKEDPQGNGQYPLKTYDQMVKEINRRAGTKIVLY